MSIELIAQLAQIPLASAMLIALVWVYAQSNKMLDTVLEKQAKQDDDAKQERSAMAQMAAEERKRVAERDDKMLDLYRQHVESQHILSSAIDGMKSIVGTMLSLEQQNATLLQKVVELQEGNAGMLQTNSIALQTLTGSMDAMLAKLTSIEAAVEGSTGDKRTITQELRELKQIARNIEANLPKPTPPKPPASHPRAESPTIVIRPGAQLEDDDEQDTKDLDAA